MTDERRRSPRYSASVKVDYYPAASNILYSTTTAKNISQGGICIPVLPRLVRKGDYIKLDIFPDAAGTPVPATGRVMWTRETSALKESSPFEQEAGIEFTDVNSDMLQNLVQSFAG